MLLRKLRFHHKTNSNIRDILTSYKTLHGLIPYLYEILSLYSHMEFEVGGFVVANLRQRVCEGEGQKNRHIKG